eukprot:gene14700-17368_t
MEAALEHFQVDVRGVTAMDAGLSTGGFTDCLLQAVSVALAERLGQGAVHVAL